MMVLGQNSSTMVDINKPDYYCPHCQSLLYHWDTVYVTELIIGIYICENRHCIDRTRHSINECTGEPLGNGDY